MMRDRPVRATRNAIVPANPTTTNNITTAPMSGRKRGAAAGASSTNSTPATSKRHKANAEQEHSQQQQHQSQTSHQQQPPPAPPPPPQQQQQQHHQAQFQAPPQSHFAPPPVPQQQQGQHQTQHHHLNSQHQHQGQPSLPGQGPPPHYEGNVSQLDQLTQAHNYGDAPGHHPSAFQSHPQAPITPGHNAGPINTPGRATSSQILPPNPRIRADGKGRDPYNIDTICRALGIPNTVWEKKLRVELNNVINKHALADAKVIPSNAHARDLAVDEWIQLCPEWLNEPNEIYRKVYAMDRLKCGMADIRRSRSQKTRRKKEEDGITEGKPEGNDTVSPDHGMSPAMNMVDQAPLAPLPPTSHSRDVPMPAPMAPPNMDTPPPQGLPLGAPPHPNMPVNPIMAFGMPPEFVQLTIVEPFSNRRAALNAPDFMPNGEFSLASVFNILIEDLNFNPQGQVLTYEGPHGKVWIASDRNLRNAVSWEAGRGVKYPKWEIDRR